MDRRVVGWSAGRHVDHPCGGQLSPWPARNVTEITLATKLSRIKCLPNCLFPRREGFLSSFKINPAVRVTARQVRGKNCLAAFFAPRHQSVSSGPLGRHRNLQFGAPSPLDFSNFPSLRLIYFPFSPGLLCNFEQNMEKRARRRRKKRRRILSRL